MTDEAHLLEDLRIEVGKCVNCGFCESVCPTLPAAGFRPIIGARGRVDLAKYFLDQVDKGGKSDLRISEAFYSCLDCYACVHVCPASVNAGKISEMGRRVIVERNHLTGSQEMPVANMIVSATNKHQNPLGVRTRCSDWARGLEFDTGSSTLLYTGNMYQLMAYNASLARMESIMGERLSDFVAGVVANHPSLLFFARFAVDRRLKGEMNSFLRSIYSLLRASGLRFNYLGEAEPYPGTLTYELGYEDDFVKYGSQVVNHFREKGVKTVVTVDPHTYDLLKNKYPKYFPNMDFEVVHYLDYLKNLNFKEDSETVAYHEPCYFVLREETYDTPPELLSRIAHVKYPQRSGKRTMCCGGPDEAIYAGISRAVSSERLAQLREVGTRKIVTACPICYSNLRSDTGVVDISAFLEGHLK